MGFLQTSFARARRALKGFSSTVRSGWRSEQRFYQAEQREERALDDIDRELRAIQDAQARDTARVAAALHDLERGVHELELSDAEIGTRIVNLVRGNADLMRARFDVVLQIMREFELLIRELEERSRTWDASTIRDRDTHHAMAELLKEEFTKVDAQLATLRENIYDSLETLQQHYRALETGFSADLVSASAATAATMGLRTAKQDSGNLQDLRTFQRTLSTLAKKLEHTIEKGADNEAVDTFLTTLSTYGDGLQQLLRLLRDGAALEFQLLEQDLRAILQHQRDLRAALDRIRALEGQERDRSRLQQYRALERRVAALQERIRDHAQEAGAVIRGPTALVKEGGGVLMKLRASFLAKAVAVSLLGMTVVPRPDQPAPHSAVESLRGALEQLAGFSLHASTPRPVYPMNYSGHLGAVPYDAALNNGVGPTVERAQIEIMEDILRTLSDKLNDEFRQHPIEFYHPENKPGERPAPRLKDPASIHRNVQEGFRKLGPVLLQYLRHAPRLGVSWKLYINITPSVSMDSGTDASGKPLSQDWILAGRGELVEHETLREVTTHLASAGLIETGPDGVAQPLVEAIVEQGNIARAPYNIAFPQARSAAAWAHYGTQHQDPIAAQEVERILQQDRNAKVCFSISITHEQEPVEVIYFIPPMMPIILPPWPPEIPPPQEHTLPPGRGNVRDRSTQYGRDRDGETRQDVLREFDPDLFARNLDNRSAKLLLVALREQRARLTDIPAGWQPYLSPNARKLPDNMGDVIRDRDLSLSWIPPDILIPYLRSLRNTQGLTEAVLENYRRDWNLRKGKKTSTP